MLSGLGFYILFIFKLFLIIILSLIINYLYKENVQDSKSLKIYSILSLVMMRIWIFMVLNSCINNLKA